MKNDDKPRLPIPKFGDITVNNEVDDAITKSSNLSVDEIKAMEVDADKSVIDEKQDASNDRKQRLKFKNFFSKAIASISVFWLLFIGCVVFFNGFGFYSFHLSDTVLVTLITTTTATVYGSIHLILKHFFPSTPIKEGNREKEK